MVHTWAYKQSKDSKVLVLLSTSQRLPFAATILDFSMRELQVGNTRLLSVYFRILPASPTPQAYSKREASNSKRQTLKIYNSLLSASYPTRMIDPTRPIFYGPHWASASGVRAGPVCIRTGHDEICSPLLREYD